MSRNRRLSYTCLLEGPGAGTLFLRSLKLTFFIHAQTQIPQDYLQKIEKEIHFVWNYCPFHTEGEFARLLLNYFFSETRIHNPDSFPFRKIQIDIGANTYEIDNLKFEPQTEKTKFGLVDTLLTTTSFGVYRLRIAPGLQIPNHTHHIMQEKEMVLTSGLQLNGNLLKIGSINLWDYKVPHCYENPTDKEQSLLCIDEPAFDANDEILT